MYREKTIGVVIPAYNEEVLIGRTLRSLPRFVDHVVVVDDGSTDATAEIVENVAIRDSRVRLVRHPDNRGVGAAVGTGYVWCRDHDVDVAVVMGGDGQMDPANLCDLLDPVVEDRADYAKGNRLVTGEAWKTIPRIRYLGNTALTFMTKIASGYWHVTDSQSGYTAMNKAALRLLPLEDIYPRYGMPNDLLVTLNIFGMRVVDVPVNPIYGIGERRDIRIGRILFSLSFLIARLFLKRMIQKYVIRDFHPLVLFYGFGLMLLLVDVPLVARLFTVWIARGSVPPINALAAAFCTLMGFQSMLFAMLFDMEANRDLKGRDRSTEREVETTFHRQPARRRRSWAE
jgi:glycosyltransferase involved in cell wall biosynthesis